MWAVCDEQFQLSLKTRQETNERNSIYIGIVIFIFSNRLLEKATSSYNIDNYRRYFIDSFWHCVNENALYINCWVRLSERPVAAQEQYLFSFASMIFVLAAFNVHIFLTNKWHETTESQLIRYKCSTNWTFHANLLNKPFGAQGIDNQQRKYQRERKFSGDTRFASWKTY